jgi:ubiquinone/menaquinone biosynthesis C-methylase UbiE/DNA-binding transcriptional ArsR family regulator
MVGTFDDLVNCLRGAAEPTRMRLLKLCRNAELSVGELTDILGQSQPRVSRHLKVLVDAGLLVRAREGTNAFYRAATGGQGGALVDFLDGFLDGDDAILSADRSRLEQVRAQRAAVAAAYFRRNAEQWDRIRSLYVDEADVEASLVDLVPAGRYVDHLDVGTGTGRIVELVASRVEHGIGIDLSREMLTLARSRLDRAGLATCHVRHGDMYRLPWPDDTFDLVTFHLVLHFAEDPAAAIKEAARVLRSDGRLIVVDFAPHDLEFLRTEHAHRRLGLGEAEVNEWMVEAGLDPMSATKLPGGQLTVMIWSADRPRVTALAAAAGGR